MHVKIIVKHNLTLFYKFQKEHWNVLDRNREDALATWNTWKGIIIKVGELEAKRDPIKKVLQNYKEIPEGISVLNGKKDIIYLPVEVK